MLRSSTPTPPKKSFFSHAPLRKQAEKGRKFVKIVGEIRKKGVYRRQGEKTTTFVLWLGGGGSNYIAYAHNHMFALLRTQPDMHF